MWRGTGEHNRPGTQEVNVVQQLFIEYLVINRATSRIEVSTEDACKL